MKENLHIAAIQSELLWEEKQANLAHFEEVIWSLEDNVDLILLPETFNAGFSINPAIAEPMNLHTHRWMRSLASQKKATIAGSFLIKEGGQLYNRFLFIKPNGEELHYDKRHLFILSEEAKQLTPGESKSIVDIQGWKICPMICYDLRFPVWARNLNLEYDCLVYTANWPSKRIDQWEVMLKSRAIENQSYVLGLNRIGEDGNDIDYNGHSLAVNFDGMTIKQAGQNSEVLTVVLSASKLKDYREKFPVHKSADQFQIG